MRLLELEILALGDRLIISAQERVGSAGRPLAILEEQPLSWDQARRMAREVEQALAFPHEAQATRTRLEQLGLRLFDFLLGPRVKRLVRETRSTHLLFSLTSPVLELPWELLHTGEDFLCLRFATGRTVRLEATVETRDERTPQPPYRMLVLSDPRGDLPQAAREGVELLRSLGPQEASVRVDLLAAPVTRQQVIDELRRYDLVHYAGHAQAGREGSPSAWLLDDAPFSTDDVIRMQGASSFPFLIFANACVSGRAGDFGANAMPRALLSVGARHYVGSVADLPDTTSRVAAREFYASLLRGASVGESLQAARKALSADSSLAALAWASYLLYGDPVARYFALPARPTELTAGRDGGEPRASEPRSGEPRAGEPRAGEPRAGEPRDEGPEGGTLDVSMGTGGATASGSLEVGAWTGAPPSLGWQRWLHKGLQGLGRHRSFFLGGLAGLGLGLLGAVGALGQLDLVWEAGRYLVQRPGGWFQSRVVLLTVPTERLSVARGLYADLLEALNASRVVPRLVAIDTWFQADRRTEDDGRLARALAESLERYPVVLGLETDPRTGEVKPPPAWLESLLAEALEARFLLPCQDERSRQSQESVKGCASRFTQMYRTERLRFGRLQVERPGWIFEHFGLRVELVRKEGVGAGESITWQGPHFATLLACPEVGSMEPAGERLRACEGRAQAAWDQWGRMPVVFTGAASFTGGPSFPAYELEALLASWARAPAQEASVPADRSPDVDPGPGLPGKEELMGRRILVGAGSPLARGNEMDRYDTPIGKLFGVEVLANVAESLVRDSVPAPLPVPGLQLAAGLAGGLLGTSAAGKSRGLLRLVGVALGGLVASYALLLIFRLSFPPTAFLLALLPGFVLASWAAARRGSLSARLRPLGRVTGLLLTVLLLGAGSSQALAQAARTAPSGKPASARPAGQAQPASLPGAGKALSAAPRPVPPAAIKPVVSSPGWRVVYVSPPDLMSSGGLSLAEGAGSLQRGAGLPAGSRLRSRETSAEVLLEYRDPARGFLARHALQGTFEAALEADGTLRFQGGTIWTHLFRSLEQAVGVLSVEYEGVPAGFGSTEVAFGPVAPGAQEKRLTLLEGKVRYARSGKELELVGGQEVRWGKRPGKPQAVAADRRQALVAAGTVHELKLLPAETLCAGNAPALAGSGLASQACFASREARDEALREARGLLSGEPTAGAWEALGRVYLASGDATAAAGCFVKGMRVGGDAKVQARLRLELGNVRWLQGELTSARAAYEQATTLDPGLGAAWNNLAVMQWRAEELSAARDSLSRATGADPGLGLAWRNLGNVLVAEQPGKAAEAWTRAAQLEGADPSLWRDIGLARAAAGDKVGAVTAAVESLKQDPAQAELWYTLGQWYWEQGRKQEALDAYGRGAELESQPR